MKSKTLVSKRKIRFQDCDPFNHLNNSKYIDYFVNVREDQVVDHYDLDVYGLINTDRKAWVVADHKISYVTPAKTHEIVLIESQLIRYSSKSLTVEMKMFSEDRSVLKAILWTTYVHVDLTSSKATSHDSTLTELFEEVHTPTTAQSFDERVQEVRMAASS